MDDDPRKGKELCKECGSEVELKEVASGKWWKLDHDGRPHFCGRPKKGKARVALGRSVAPVRKSEEDLENRVERCEKCEGLIRFMNVGEGVWWVLGWDNEIHFCKGR